jgi:sialate O-acetylesterase
MNFVLHRFRVPRFRHFLYLLAMLSPVAISAQLRLPRYISDNMILQRDRPVTIRGWAAAGETVKVMLNDIAYSAIAKNDSTWSVQLKSHKAGGPYTLRISTVKENITVNNILFGDIWFCSGQSNMNFRAGGVNNFEQERKDAAYPMIRQLDGNRVGSEIPQQDILQGKWVICDSTTVQAFSAVAFFFAKELYAKYKVPVGIINASWGGSPIQTFMSAEAMAPFPEYKGKIDSITPSFIRDTKEKYKLINHKWALKFYALSDYISQDLKLTRDTGFFDADNWKKIHVPGYLENQGLKPKHGISWYKKEFNLDQDPAGDFNIDLGRIKLSCAVFVNGQFVGRQFSIWYNANYKIPAGILRNGVNEILVCSYNEGGETGFQPFYKPRLINNVSKKSVMLEGEWLYKQGKVFEKPGTLGSLTPLEYFEHQYPTLVYNSMIAPFHQYEIKGFLWYQGEDNSKFSQCYAYENMLSGMIKSWRNAWNDTSLPFLIVQLANFHRPGSGATPWTIVQEAQTRVGANIPHAGTIVINDIGDAVDIHPRNKQEVGRRLALAARKIAYGEKKLVASGPVFKSFRKEKDELIIHFDNIGSGLVSKDGAESLNAFFLAGEDGIFHKAVARINGNKVVVTADKVPDPVYLRYAFEDNPGKVNFYNRDGLPAVPFRTDTLRIQ